MSRLSDNDKNKTSNQIENKTEKHIYQSVQYFQVDSDMHDQRIDNALFKRLKDIPKSHIYQILRKGEVRVNGKRIKPEYKLQLDDKVRLPPLILNKPRELYIPKETLDDIEKSIIWENNDLVVLNKPAGIPVHSGSGHRYGIIDALHQIYGNKNFLELVHRLDIETSGCLLIAKNRLTLNELHQQLSTGKIQKTYLTLVKGLCTQRQITINAPLAKFNRKIANGDISVHVDRHGKPAITKFEIVSARNDTTLLHAFPMTGRTHQIRVHAAHMGYPIAGDPRYGDSEWNYELAQLGLNRIFLHALSVEFQLKNVSHPIKISAKLAPDLDNFLKLLGY